MITLTFRFPAGRYHATPWGHHVNEGLVEWPPCPWRILRALIATGYAKLGWSGIPENARSLIQKIQEVLPVYALPDVAMAHSRHYMPLDSIGKTTLVLDTWLNIEAPLQVQWAVHLNDAEKQLLATLVSQMNYLGRSESWVDAVLTDEDKPLQANCFPHDNTQSRDPLQEELVNLLVPQGDSIYSAWRIGQLPPSESGKQTKAKEKARKKLEEAYPQSVLEALQWDTIQWKKQGWNLPPGSTWVQYRRPLGIMDTKAVQTSSPSRETINLFLLSLSTVSGNMSALPTIARTLPQAEILHQTLVSKSDPGKTGHAPKELTGKDEQGRSLSGHRHTHILPVDLDEDGHLDHILLWSPMGFTLPAQEAIRKARRTWAKGAPGDLHLAIAGHADLSHITELPRELRSYIGQGTTWISSSPFVPPRYLKKKGVNSIEGQLLAELKQRGFPEPTNIEVARFPESEDMAEAQRNLFRHFVRGRLRGGMEPPQDSGIFVRLTFSTPVQGPICLGYGSHFGMGLFRCEDAK
jgi:CRISPR-associated protein Csb2